MGVYIKGMKMPKDDVHAFKQITITNNWVDGEVIMLAHDTITNEFIGEVVEVPEPHGRLIDENELGGLIHRMWVAKQLTNTKYNTFNNLLDIVKPVIEAEE